MAMDGRALRSNTMSDQITGLHGLMSDTVVVTRTRDGGIQVEITCPREDKSKVINVIHQMSQDCIDDAYGMYEKVREHEALRARMKMPTELAEPLKVLNETERREEFEG